MFRIFTALVICAGAVAALMLGLAAWMDAPSDDRPPADVYAFDLERLVARTGAGQANGEAWQLTALNPGGQGLATGQYDNLPAADYGHVRYRISGFPPNNDLVFFWRTSEAPTQPGFLDLHPPADGQTQTFRMHGRAGWEGTIIEAGLAVFPLPQVAAPSRNISSMVIEELALVPSGTLGSLSAIITEWTAFRPWSFRSINSLRDSPKLRIEPSPVLFAGVSALVCSLILGWFPGLNLGWFRALGLCLLAGWLILDLRWQSNLSAQNRATEAIFRNVDSTGRSAQMGDYDLVALTNAAKPLIEESPGDVRIFVATQTTYLSLRAAYHLAPYRTAAFMPGENRGAAETLKAGDYVLVHRMPGARFDPASQTLSFRRVQFAANRLLGLAEGSLFRVTGPAVALAP